MIRRIFLLLAATVLITGCTTTIPMAQPDAVYYLVRHAEKTKDKKDPALTEEGTKRAQDLAERLTGVELTAIYSSDYKRTRDTAAPVAAAKNLDVIIYDPRDLDGFAKSLLTQTGRILIAGHSNTTPQLSGLLGGMTGEPIVEATEYDRLYIVTRNGDEMLSLIERYGK